MFHIIYNVPHLFPLHLQIILYLYTGRHTYMYTCIHTHTHTFQLLRELSVISIQVSWKGVFRLGVRRSHFAAHAQTAGFLPGPTTDADCLH